jgi:hypothetical protein
MKFVYIVHPDRPADVSPVEPSQVKGYEDSGWKVVEDQAAARQAHEAAIAAANPTPTPADGETKVDGETRGKRGGK